MKKSVWIIGFLILAIVIGFFIGIYMYNAEANEEQMENSFENIDNNNLIDINIVNKIEIETSVTEEKVSINTEVIEEVYYTECDHLVKVTRNNIKNIVNMTKHDLEEKYPEWQIKEFSKERVVLYKEESNYCGEHYLIKDVDGFITIYSTDNSDNIKERIEITDIETAYLPEKDQEMLKQGMKIYSEQQLNKLIEDFE